MKEVKQTTLFQSWGNQKKEASSFNGTEKLGQYGTCNTERPSVSTVTSGNDQDGGVIDLCDSFDDADDELLYQAEETVNLEFNNQVLRHGDFGQNVNDGNACNDDRGTEADVYEEENECNISVGAESFTLTQKQSLCKNVPGFDMCAGKLWIYPTNYPVRDYQYNIVQQSLFKNTMVTLPTGLGKTFIAAVVMYNFYRWYPQGKVVFMAPTKPLVAQQIEACYNIMGIPQDHTAEMTGNMKPPKREKAWHEKRVFFLTPQVLTNDLSRGSVPAENVKCLVIDEAHKALGNHAYCQVVRELVKYTENFRVLALSATPGSDIKAVQQVLTNLNISHIEIRTEESIDIKQYSHERKVDKVVVPLGEELTKVKEKYIHIIDIVVSRLKRQGVLYNRDTSSLSKFLILKSRDAFRQNPPERLPRSQYGSVEGDYALAMSLYHGFELLQLHGSRSLYNFLESILTGDKGHGRTKAELTRNADFNDIMETLSSRYSAAARKANSTSEEDKSFVAGHPKMEKLQEIVLEHFNKFVDQGLSATRVMIFSQYRDSVQEITDMLNVHRPIVKVMSFIGQSSAGKATKGFTQKEQLKVMKQFREGGYNTLVSTCVGEEGLDIGDVDLIICFDAHKSPIRLVQRMGRTGRKREGRIVMLVTQGKEEQIYNQSQYSKRSIHKAILNGARSLHFYQHSPRMVPEHMDPKPHKMYITVKESFKPSKRISGDAKTEQNKKTSLFDKGKKGDKEDVISVEQYQELKDWLVDSSEVPAAPETHLMCLDRGDNEVNDRRMEGTSCRLSLTDWTPWQSTFQQHQKIDHSTRTKHLVQLMEFIQLQQSMDADDDPYGLEMAAYLNEDDVLKPGESEAGPDTILRYCVSRKPEKSREDNNGNLDTRKQIRRSDALRDFEDDNKDDESSDDNLPPFVLSTDRQETNESLVNKHLQESFIHDHENSAMNLDGHEKSNAQNDHGQFGSKVITSKKKNVGSRAKSLERRMSESILRKSKKRKRNKISSNHTTVVQVIADNDSHDFDNDRDIIPGDTKDVRIDQIHDERTVEIKDIRSKETENNRDTKKLVDIANTITKHCRVGSAPSIDEAIVHCKHLDDNHFEETTDVFDLVSEFEKDNVKAQTNMSGFGNRLTVNSSKYDKSSRWVTSPVKDNLSTTDEMHRYFEIRKQNDILLSELYSDFGQKNTEDKHFLTFSHNIHNGRKISSADTFNTKEESFDYSKPGLSIADCYSVKLMPVASAVRVSQTSSIQNDVTGSSPSSEDKLTRNQMLASQNASDSSVGSTADPVVLITKQSPKIVANNIRTQVTFSQAMACIHSSNGSEPAVGNTKLIADYNETWGSEEYDDNNKNLPTPDFCFNSCIGVNEVLSSTGQFSVIEKDTNLPIEKDTNVEPFHEKNAKQDKTLSKSNDIKVEVPTLENIEQTISGLEEDTTDLPQFDLGFDFDDDIVPPSPNATQQSQKCRSNFVCQSFLSRMSQSMSNGVITDNHEPDKRTKKELFNSMNDVSECPRSKQSLSFTTDKRVKKLDLKKETNYYDTKTSKATSNTDLECVLENREYETVSESKSDRHKVQCHLQHFNAQTKEDKNNSEHDEVLKVAEFQSSLDPVAETSFCLMDGNDLGDWFDSEPEVTENTKSITSRPACEEEDEFCQKSYNELMLHINDLKPCFIGDTVSNDSYKVCNPAKGNCSSKLTDNHPGDNVIQNNEQLTEGGEVLIKCGSELKTPISIFKKRKSVFTVDDFSPDPFSDSFDFEDMGFSKTENIMTSLKTKVKPAVASSTPKLYNSPKQSPKISSNFDIPSKSPQLSQQKESLPLDSDSDDSFVVRKKKKAYVIQSPCSQKEDAIERNSQINPSVFKTPFRERVFNKRINTNKNAVKRLESNNLAKQQRVGFLNDDDDFDDVKMTKKKGKSMTVISECSSDEDFDEPLIRKKKMDISEYSVDSSSPPFKARKKRGSNPFIEEEAELSDDGHAASSDESEQNDNLDHYEASFIHDTEQFSQSQSIGQTQMHAVYMKSVKSPAGPGRFKLQYDYRHSDVFSQIPEEESQYMEDSFCVGENDDDWLGGYEEKIEPAEVTLMHPETSLLKTGRTRRQKGAKKVIESGYERELHQGRMKALDKLRSKIALKNRDKFTERGNENMKENLLKKSRLQGQLAEKECKRTEHLSADLESPEIQTKKKSRIQIHDLSSEDDSMKLHQKSVDFQSPEIKSKKKRLKHRIFSSSEEEDIEMVNKVEMISDNFADSVSDKSHTKLKDKATCLKETTADRFDSELFLVSAEKSKNKSKAVILVDSKEISGSQDIISDLRFKHGMNVSAAQLPGCDYIISNRMAVERKQWSEFSNGANREKLTERIQALNNLYDRPILIVEKDRIKPGEEKCQKPVHWTKYVDKTVALLLKSSVRVLYTDNQQETATLLSDLCQLEVRKGMGISVQVDLNTEQQNKVKFYSTIPKLGYINALNLAHGFKTVSEFMKSSIQMIQSKGKMSENRAVDVYKFLRRQFDTDMLTT